MSSEIGLTDMSQWEVELLRSHAAVLAALVVGGLATAGIALGGVFFRTIFYLPRAIPVGIAGSLVLALMLNTPQHSGVVFSADFRGGDKQRNERVRSSSTDREATERPDSRQPRARFAVARAMGANRWSSV